MAEIPEGVQQYLIDVECGLRKPGYQRPGRSPLDERGLSKPRGFDGGDWVVKYNGEEVFRSTSQESAWKFYHKAKKGL